MKAAQMATRYLQGARFLEDESTVPESTRDGFVAFSSPFVKLVFEQPDARVTVLWAHEIESVQAGEIEIQAWGSNISLINSQDEVVYYRCDLKPGDAIPIPTLEGAPSNLPLPGNTSNSVVAGMPAIGGPVYILVESIGLLNRAPTGSADVICQNGRAIGTDLWGYDEDSGLASLTVACSPARTYDLSWTQPGVHYAGTAPAKDSSCTLTLTDRDGLTVTQTIRNDCQDDGSAGSNPGGDHPDDNHSAAGPPIPSGEFFALPEGARVPPRVAILNRGASHELWLMVLGLGEPATRIDADFDPASTVAQYPVLLIPSGGLYGLEHSASFRARLEEYTRLGGVIVAFSQQHGYEYGVLPSSEVGAYGWTEDNSCFDASLYLSEWHPALSGFDRATLNVHVDGYFTSVPTGTHTLLSRTANGQPAAILYPFPPGGGTEGGWVFATTIYDDWGTGHGQQSADSLTLLRDLLTWAILPPGGGEPEGGLPQFTPGTVSLSIPITNTTPYTAAAVSLRLVDPARQIALTRTVTATVPAGVAVIVPFTATATAPLGVWRIDATLLTQHDQIARFIVANPAAPVDPVRDLSLSITAPNDHFIPNSVAPFTFHVFNHGDVERTATVRYGLPHHTWESGDGATYGHFDDHRHTLTVPPHGEAIFTWRVPVFTTDRLWAQLREGGRLADRAHFAVFRALASAQVHVAADPATWVRGRPVTTMVTVTNRSPGTLTGTLELQFTDSSGTQWHTAVLPLALPAEGQAVLSTTATVPVTVSDGSALVAAYVRDGGGTVVGGGHAAFDVPSSPLVFAATLPETLVPGATQAITVAAVNASPTLTVTGGSLSLALTDPQGVTTTLGSRAFGLALGAETELIFPFTPPQPHFGDYAISFQATDEHGGRSWRESLSSQVMLSPQFNRLRYGVGDVLQLDLSLLNGGDFREALQVFVEIPDVTYSNTHTMALEPGQQAVLSDTLTVPTSIGPGGHPITVTLTQSSGNVRLEPLQFHVPPSELRAALEQSTAAVGDIVTLAVTNAGGAAASGEVEFSVLDARGTSILATSAALHAVAPGTSVPVTFTVPPGAVSGLYYARGRTTDAQTGQLRPFALPLQIAGISASVDTRTLEELYLAGETITSATTLTSTGTDVNDGQLRLEVVWRVAEPEWMHFRADLGMATVMDIEIDPAGREWIAAASSLFVLDDRGTPFYPGDDIQRTFAQGGQHLVLDDDLVWIAGVDGIALLDYGGTLFDESDDRWITYTVDDGLVNNGVSDLVVDADGYVWAVAYGGVSVLDHGGTPFDKSDDQWVTFTVTDGLVSNYVYALAIDSTGIKWFPTFGGLSALMDGGTPFDKSDDVWQTFTQEDGLVGNRASIAIDDVDRIWCGASVLDYSGTLLDKSDDRWAYFDGDVWDVFTDSEGHIWFTSHEDGVSVLDHAGTPFDKSDDQWVTFTWSDGLGSGTVKDIAFDGFNRVWFGNNPNENDFYGGVSVLDHKGTLFDKSDDDWQTSVSNGLASDYYVNALALDPAGRM